MYVALLRAINVAGHQMVGMADLRAFLADLGFGEPRSLLQSGNLVFGGRKRPARQLEQFLEAEARKRLDLPTDFFVRTADEWAGIVARNPFPDEAVRDPGHLLVMFLKDTPGDSQVKALQAGISGREIVRAHGPHAYIFYPDGVGRSKLTNARIEKALGTRATGRNWNTVRKLAAMVAT